MEPNFQKEVCVRNACFFFSFFHFFSKKNLDYATTVRPNPVSWGMIHAADKKKQINNHRPGKADTFPFRHNILRFYVNKNVSKWKLRPSRCQNLPSPLKVYPPKPEGTCTDAFAADVSLVLLHLVLPPQQPPTILRWICCIYVFPRTLNNFVFQADTFEQMLLQIKNRRTCGQH